MTDNQTEPKAPSQAQQDSAGRPMTVLGSLARRMGPRREWSDEDRSEALRDLYPHGADAVDFVWRFTTLMVLSTVIAAFGLLANSAAVVIGAMLVAPLMTPILGVSFSVLLGDLRRLLQSVGLIGFGLALAIAAAYAVSALAPVAVTSDDLTGELLARTEPSLLDLGVAIAAGLAAGYVMTHPRAGSSLPGVAIAVALVPPLATVGVALQLGAGDRAEGALLLFATNLLAIVLAAMVVGLVAGIAPTRRKGASWGGVRTGLLVTVVMLVVVAVPLAAHTFEVLEDRSFARRAVSAIGEWDPNSRIIELDADAFNDGRGEVSVVVSTNSEPLPAWELAAILRERTGRQVSVDVEFVVGTADRAVAN